MFSCKNQKKVIAQEVQQVEKIEQDKPGPPMQSGIPVDGVINPGSLEELLIALNLKKETEVKFLNQYHDFNNQIRDIRNSDLITSAKASNVNRLKRKRDNVLMDLLDRRQQRLYKKHLDKQF